MSNPRYILRYKNTYNEVTYLVRFGATFRGIRLVVETTKKPEEAFTYETMAEAAMVVETAVMPAGWEAVPL